MYYLCLAFFKFSHQYIPLYFRAHPMLYFSNGKWRAAMKIIYTSIAASIAIVFALL